MGDFYSDSRITMASNRSRAGGNGEGLRDHVRGDHQQRGVGGEVAHGHVLRRVGGRVLGADGVQDRVVGVGDPNPRFAKGQGKGLDRETLVEQARHFPDRAGQFLVFAFLLLGRRRRLVGRAEQVGRRGHIWDRDRETVWGKGDNNRHGRGGLGGAGRGGARRGVGVWVVAHVVVALGFGLGGSCFGHVHVGLHVVQLVQLAGFLQANVLGDLVDVTWDEI